MTAASVFTQEFIQTLEELVRGGRAGEARQILRAQNLSQIPREGRKDLANLARRAGAPEIAIRILNPVVRPNEGKPESATDQEKAEYAVALINHGAVPEGLEILEALRPDTLPEALLYRSFGLFARWDYLEAIPLLKNYIKGPLTDYQRLVGNVNLAAALIVEKKSGEAQKVLETALQESKRLNAHLLNGNCLELSAQLAIQREAFTDAKNHLERAADVLRRAGNIDEFFVKKWMAILALKKKPKSAEAALAVRRIRSEAIKKSHWETVRDCDFYLSLCRSDSGLATHLYHGTPYEGFRRRIKAEAPRQEIPAEYVWQLGRSPGDRIFDLERGREARRGDGIKVRQLPHRLLQALASDFYRPLRTATLFSILFQGEYFNPDNSPARIYQALSRLRIWLTETGIPLLIDESAGYFSLRSEKPYGILTRLRSEQAENIRGRSESLFEALREIMKDRSFSSREAGEALGISLRSAIRLLNWASKTRLVTSRGRRRACRYTISQPA
jgi:hypothetical protein